MGQQGVLMVLRVLMRPAAHRAILARRITATGSDFVARRFDGERSLQTRELACTKKGRTLKYDGRVLPC